MSPPPVHCPRLSALLSLLAGWAVPGHADSRVAIVASADPAYTERKYAGGTPRTETYVFMEGHYFEGQTVDRSLEKMTFRQIAEYLAPELAKQAYVPGRDARSADLLLVVHWGVTLSRTGTQEMLGRTTFVTDISGSVSAVNRDAMLAQARDDIHDGETPSPGLIAMLEVADPARFQLETDRFERIYEQAAGEVQRGDNIRLLGYADTLHRMGKLDPFGSATEETLRSDLNSERYFVIVCAYALHAGRGRSRPVWKMHLNIRSPGNNFRTAMTRMSGAAVGFLGRTSDGVATVRPARREGTVKVAPLIILGEVKPGSK